MIWMVEMSDRDISEVSSVDIKEFLDSLLALKFVKKAETVSHTTSYKDKNNSKIKYEIRVTIRERDDG